MQDEKVTVQVAAKALNVTPKTIHQWLRTGTLTRVKDGNRTYILMDEVRALRQTRVTNPKSEVIGSIGDSAPGYNLSNNIVPIDRDHYEGLLTRLGQLEANQQLLLEYKGGLEAKDRELSETKATLAANSSELEQARATIARARNELQRLIEYKQDSEAKGEALSAREKEVADLRAENAWLRLTFWRRWFRKK